MCFATDLLDGKYKPPNHPSVTLWLAFQGICRGWIEWECGYIQFSAAAYLLFLNCNWNLLICLQQKGLKQISSCRNAHFALAWSKMNYFGWGVVIPWFPRFDFFFEMKCNWVVYIDVAKKVLVTWPHCGMRQSSLRLRIVKRFVIEKAM